MMLRQQHLCKVDTPSHWTSSFNISRQCVCSSSVTDKTFNIYHPVDLIYILLIDILSLDIDVHSFRHELFVTRTTQ